MRSLHFGLIAAVAAAFTAGCASETSRPQLAPNAGFEAPLVIPSMAAASEAKAHGQEAPGAQWLSPGAAALESDAADDALDAPPPNALPPSDIRASIKDCLMTSRHLSVGAKRVKIDVAHGGAVTMVGRVKNHAERVVVEKVAEATEGVTSVDTSQVIALR